VQASQHSFALWRWLTCQTTHSSGSIWSLYTEDDGTRRSSYRLNWLATPGTIKELQSINCYV